MPGAGMHPNSPRNEPRAMSEDEFRAFTRTSRWTFAKTMPDIPHEYTLRRHSADDTQFASAVQFIRDEGYRGLWRDRVGTYWDDGVHQYWTMGAPVEETILINRGRLDSPTAARRI